MFAAGVVAALIGIEQRHLQAAIDTVLGGKGAEIIAANRRERRVRHRSGRRA